MAALAARTFADTFAGDNRPEDIESYLAEAFSPTAIEAELLDPRNRFWLARDHRASAIGYAKLRQSEPPSGVRGSPSIELHRLYVAQDALGTGLGSELMSTILDWAASQGYESVWLGVWERNPRAIAFYERWGFAAVGEQDFRLGFDAQTDVIMERPTPAVG